MNGYETVKLTMGVGASSIPGRRSPGPYPEHDFPTKREASEWEEKIRRLGG